MIPSLLLVLGLLAQSDEATVEAIQLQSFVLKERQRIERGVFDIVSGGWTTSQGKRHDYRYQLRAYLDRDSLRNDVREVVHNPDYVDLRSWGPRIVVNYSDRPLQDGQKLAATVIDLAISKKLGPRGNLFVDPRVLGACATTMMTAGQKSLAAEFGTLGAWRVLAVVDDVLDGQACRKIAMTNTRGTYKTVWIDPSRDYSVLRNLITLDGGAFTRDLRTKLTRVTPAGRWFPESFDLVQVDQGQTFGEEHATIKVVSMNQPIDPDSFELTTMNIAPGTPISVSSAKPVNGSLQWNGAAIVALDPRLAPPQDRSSQTVFFGLAGTCAAVAAVLVWVVLGRKPVAA